MEKQKCLEELLKKKGIGPKGSKSLGKEEINDLKDLMLSSEVSLTTKATMLTALLTLEPAEAESVYIDEIESNPSLLPPELKPFLPRHRSDGFLSLIKKAISGQDLSFEESLRGMDHFFDPAEPEYLKASFLEAERLKRESFDENKAFFTSLWNRVDHVKTDLPLLIHICDSFDGSNRSRNFSLFTAALLGAAGFPTLVTGIDEVAPKSGFTSHQILKEAGKDPLITVDKAIEELTTLGWTYLDQQVYFPALYGMKKMRREMVKRPFLATFEKLLQPIRSSGKNLIVTGYTHSHYREELVKQLREQGKCEQALVLKGVEGSTHISMSRETVCIHFNGKDILDSSVKPSDYGLSGTDARIDKDLNARICFEEGISALKGENNYARQNILYLACLLCEKFSLLKDPAVKLNEILNRGLALKSWENKA